MPIALAQSTSIGYTGIDSTTTGSLTTTASGSTFLIAAHWQNGSGAPTVSDSKSNTYTLIGSVRQVDNNGSYLSHIGLWYVENGTGGGSHTFTVAKTGGAASVYVCEITGGLTSGILDQNNGAALDNSSPVTSGSITTTQADELLIGFVGTFQNSADPVFTPGNGFSTLEEVTDQDLYWTGCLSYQIVSSIGTYEVSTGVTALLQAAALIASFKEDGGGIPAAVLAALQYRLRRAS